jgi:hypothetical protein
LPFVLAQYAAGHEPPELSRGKPTTQTQHVVSHPQFERLAEATEPSASNLHEGCQSVV